MQKVSSARTAKLGAAMSEANAVANCLNTASPCLPRYMERCRTASSYKFKHTLQSSKNTSKRQVHTYYNSCHAEVKLLIPCLSSLYLPRRTGLGLLALAGPAAAVASCLKLLCRCFVCRRLLVLFCTPFDLSWALLQGRMPCQLPRIPAVADMALQTS